MTDKMSAEDWERHVRPVYERHFTPDEQDIIKARNNDFDQAQSHPRVGRSDRGRAAALQAKGDPGSPQAMDLARRWMTQVQQVHRRRPRDDRQVRAGEHGGAVQPRDGEQDAVRPAADAVRGRGVQARPGCRLTFGRVVGAGATAALHPPLRSIGRSTFGRELDAPKWRVAGPCAAALSTLTGRAERPLFGGWPTCRSKKVEAGGWAGASAGWRPGSARLGNSGPPTALTSRRRPSGPRRMVDRPGLCALGVEPVDL